MSDLPPAPAPPTQIVGQQSAPSTAVPVGGVPQSTSFTLAGRKTNTAAVVSLVTAIVAPFGHVIGVGGITLTIISLFTGHMALNQIKKTGEDGHTLAVIGLIISYIHLIVTALVVVFLFGVVVAFLTFLLHSVASAG
jgi:peptidyl-prolyl cis-trans isomerase B (cyclophilin B)